MRRRPRPLIIGWTPIAGRQHELARALDARCFVLYPSRRLPRWATPARYVLSALITILVLIRHRPRVVVVTNPPVFAGLVVAAYTTLSRGTFVLDSIRVASASRAIASVHSCKESHRAVAARARAVLVTDAALAARVDAWGGRGLVFHEAPGEISATPAPPLAPRPAVLFVCIFAPDEPVALVLEAARRVPGIDVRITGDPSKADPALLHAAPPNVTWLGFLPPTAYREELAATNLVLVLTDEEHSIVRAGYEAVWAGRPLVVSDTPGLRNAFPDAVHTTHNVEEVCAALQHAVRHYGELCGAAGAARTRQAATVEQQLARLRAALA